MTSNHPQTTPANELSVRPEHHAKAILNMLEDFSEDKRRAERTQHAVFNILEDFLQEKGRLEETQSATLNILEDFSAESSKTEEIQHAVFNMLDDFSQEKGRLEETQSATLNILEDFGAEGSKTEEIQRAVFNMLEDFSQEKGRLEETQSATLNILEDFGAEGSKTEEMQRAVLNILQDFSEEKGRLEETQRATLNLLEDFDAERSKAEAVSGELRESVALLRAAKEATEASNRELEAFSYSVSHDLRAPLRHILGFSNILSEEYGSTLPPEAQRHVQRIQQGTQRMGKLIDDLLSLARLGRQGLCLGTTSLKRLVEETIAESLPDFSGREVEWKVSDLPSLECDASLMRQVFQNLLSNALKFTRSRARAVIEVGQKRQGGTPVIFVRDNGVGFSMKYADKLFGVFQRLHRAEDFEGTGVGLATVQRIIQKHGGRIWAEAELDKGAAFYFTLGASDAGKPTSQAAYAGATS